MSAPPAGGGLPRRTCAKTAAASGLPAFRASVIPCDRWGQTGPPTEGLSMSWSVNLSRPKDALITNQALTPRCHDDALLIGFDSAWSASNSGAIVGVLQRGDYGVRA